MPPRPPWTCPHTLVDYCDVASWKLTLGPGANYHLPQAVNGFLVPCIMQDRGCGQPVAENRWNIWSGSQASSASRNKVEEETLLHPSGLAGIIVQKITQNLLTKDPRAQRISATAHRSGGDHLCTF